MKKLFSLIILFACLSSSLIAQQFGISGELRPRFEARHGYKTLPLPTDEPATFISQRTRINLDYKSEKFNVYFSLQNVRVWGDVSTLSTNDKNGITFHEAWGEYFVSSKFSIKLGRQEISYDDQRMFGSVGWAQSARSHDAMIAKFSIGKNGKLDIGFALNSNAETLFDQPYTINQYKSLQYAWYHTNFKENIGLSVLFLNNGMPYSKIIDQNSMDQKTTYSQTIGGRLTYKKGKLNLNAATYFQTGSTPNTIKNDKIDLSASYFSANGKLALTNEFIVGIGFEYLSGNDMGSTSRKQHAFNPFYGTNHKFNGWMDYFYVGNHINNVGLIDINIPFTYKIKKFSFILTPHFFSAEGDIVTNNEKADAYLGTEIDFGIGYIIIKNVTLNIGYSQMFATESMEILKGGSKSETNNWAWAMLTFKPNFFEKIIKK